MRFQNVINVIFMFYKSNIFFNFKISMSNSNKGLKKLEIKFDKNEALTLNLLVLQY